MKVNAMTCRYCYYLLVGLCCLHTADGMMVVKPENQIGLENTSVIFDCQLHSSSSVVWSFSQRNSRSKPSQTVSIGSSVVDPTRYKLINRTNLVILNVRENDTGLYICYERDGVPANTMRYAAQLIVLRGAWHDITDSEKVDSLDVVDMSLVSTSGYLATCRFSHIISTLSSIRCERTSIVTASTTTTTVAPHRTVTVTSSNVTLTCAFAVDNSEWPVCSEKSHVCAANQPDHSDQCVEIISQQLAPTLPTSEATRETAPNSGVANVVFMSVIASLVIAFILFGVVAFLACSRKYERRIKSLQEAVISQSQWNVTSQNSLDMSSLGNTIDNNYSLVNSRQLIPQAVEAEAESMYCELAENTQRPGTRSRQPQPDANRSDVGQHAGAVYADIDHTLAEMHSRSGGTLSSRIHHVV